MLGLPLAFSVPAVLAALALLPAIWVLLRLTPPRPREVTFPPLRLILDLRPRQETPARTPWWLLVLRLLLAAAVILAMAGPIWNPLAAGPGGRGPLLLLMDDGWPTAPDWSLRSAAAEARIVAAARDGRPIALVAASDGGREIVPVDEATARERLRALEPKPWIPDRTALVQPVRTFLTAHRDADVVWIADGLASGGARGFATALAAASARPPQVLTGAQALVAVAGIDNRPASLDVRLVRPDASGATAGRLVARDAKGLSIGEAAFAFGSATETQAKFDLPIELRNEVARVEIAGERSAGAVGLLDNRARRRRVGIVSGATTDVAQPLLAPSYYLRKALAPFAEVREARPGMTDPISALIDENVSVLVLADVGAVTGPDHDKLAQWIDKGGVLLRFAGTRLAGARSDDLVPVQLRRGGRVLGGSLSWETPKRLAPFERTSPFYGLAVPQEVTVNRQVLAEPEPGLTAKTWAALADGTPLVTAARRGKGLEVLVHVTADTTWSNLPLSGLFVDMLRRIVALSGQAPAATPGAETGTQAAAAAVPDKDRSIAPTRTLDGFGVLRDPPVTAKPIAADFDGPASADHPPGYYGPVEQARAVNALRAGDRLQRADFSGLDLRTEALHPAAPVDLRPALLGLAFLLLILDGLAAIWLSGGLRRSRRGMAGTAAALLLGLGLVAGGLMPRAQAAEGNPPVSARDIDAALHTRLAYVITGDAQVDQTSLAGLRALSRELARRTAFTPADPVGVDPARDELVFYPLIYWPIVADRPQPSAKAVAKIATFMKDGGTIVFDTRDALTARPGGPPTPEALWLRTLLAGVDVPELEPVPADHVVTKTFYLIDNFVGRTTTGQTWIEALPPVDAASPVARPVRAGDDVSPIIITSNDLAAAWATDEEGNPLYPLVPGGARQRELAIRGGINLVMYTLTGNYKADQVHVRDLLERLAH